MGLRFFRDIDLREADFVVTEKNKPQLFAECKFSDKPKESKALNYLKNKFPDIRSCIVYFKMKESFQDKNGIEHISAEKFLSELSC